MAELAEAEEEWLQAVTALEEDDDDSTIEVPSAPKPERKIPLKGGLGDRLETRAIRDAGQHRKDPNSPLLNLPARPPSLSQTPFFSPGLSY